jgi:DNA invertase Pin-like site-specific DNA recombinase
VDWFSYREEYLRSIGPFRDAVLAILAAIAKQERVRLPEHVQVGLSRAKRPVRPLGRPCVVVNRSKIWTLRDAGQSLRQIAATMKLSHGTVQRALEAR